MGRTLSSSKTIVGGPGAYTTQYTYDRAGKPLNTVYPDAYAIKNTYYAGTGLLNTVEGVSDSKVYASMTSYQPAGKMGIITYGNAAKTTFAYNAYSTRLQSIVTQNPALSPLQNRAYTYTKAGDISGIVDGIKSITFSYTYDNLHRLTGETHTGSYAYLGGPAILSNNHTDTAHINAVSATTLNGLDYSASGTELAYTYDLNGNLTEGPDFTDLSAVGTREITYNADNMPVNETYNGTAITDLTYDGDGKRAKKVVSEGSTTFYIGDHFEVEDGVPIKYLFAGNIRIAQIKGTETSYFHKDHLESATVTTDETGAATEETEYIPFGLMREHAGTEKSNYKYTDQELDKETNLYNYDARLYDPAMGMFTRPDDVTQNWYDPQTLNRYAYCRNNPLIYTDPTGHFNIYTETQGLGHVGIQTNFEGASRNYDFGRYHGQYEGSLYKGPAILVRTLGDPRSSNYEGYKAFNFPVSQELDNSIASKFRDEFDAASKTIPAEKQEKMVNKSGSSDFLVQQIRHKFL